MMKRTADQYCQKSRPISPFKERGGRRTSLGKAFNSLSRTGLIKGPIRAPLKNGAEGIYGFKVDTSNPPQTPQRGSSLNPVG